MPSQRCTAQAAAIGPAGRVPASTLDDFEGPGYERVRTTVRTEGGDVEACLYVLALPGRLSAP